MGMEIHLEELSFHPIPYLPGAAQAIHKQGTFRPFLSVQTSQCNLVALSVLENEFTRLLGSREPPLPSSSSALRPSRGCSPSLGTWSCLLLLFFLSFFEIFSESCKTCGFGPGGGKPCG